MVDIVENVIDTILNIENEQSKVLAYISELENRRKHLLGYLGCLNEDILTNGAKKKLHNKVVQMEMKVSFVESTENQPTKCRKQRKCRHNNVGYCKMEVN